MDYSQYRLKHLREESWGRGEGSWGRGHGGGVMGQGLRITGYGQARVMGGASRYDMVRRDTLF